MYTDNILIRLEREYSKDEMVIFAMNTIKELKQRNEKLSSEINKVRIENKNLLYQRIKDSELKKKVVNSICGDEKITKEDKEIFLKDKYVEGAS